MTSMAVPSFALDINTLRQQSELYALESIERREKLPIAAIMAE